MQLTTSSGVLNCRGNEMVPNSDILDLSPKAAEPPKNLYKMPNLEIVKVPVVPRPKPLKLEVSPHKEYINSVKPPPGMQLPPNSRQASDARTKNQFITGRVTPNPPSIYANVLDGRNNLEITLVSPKKSAGGSAIINSHSPPPVRNNSSVRIK